MDLSRAVITTLTLVGVLAGVPSFAARAKDPDPFDGRLIPIEAVMAFRKEIALTKSQGERIGELVVELQQGVAGKQWQMQSAYFELLEVLDAAPVDEPRALALAKRAIDTENEIKLEQIRMLIRVRNLLDDRQVEFLRARLAEGWSKQTP